MMSGKNFDSEQIADREFEFNESDFRRIKELITKHAGIVLTDAKRQLVYSRLTRRLRALNISRFSDYLELIGNDDVELVNLVNAITTNLTSFFREKHHFEYLKNQVFPELINKNRDSRRIRIWSAGCSTGEEPYSLAITVREFFERHPNWDVRILATDIDTNVVEKAQSGVYAVDRISELDDRVKKKWFVRGKGSNDGQVRVSEDVQKLISFKQLNLLQHWPMKGPFDVIFCRNVVIYFDKPTKVQLFERYSRIMAPQGHLFIGHSESLFNISDDFRLLGNTIYQKKV
ncbi:MAG: protein-glutamate O-methyltransferase CheR [Pseudomonadota bacterium]